MEKKQISLTGNSYGGLYAMEKDGKYYWGIEDVGESLKDLTNWDECDKELYDALMAFEERRKNKS